MDHGDALAPVPHNADNSLMGESTLTQLVSAEELCSIHTSIMADIQGLRARVDILSKAIDELKTVMVLVDPYPFPSHI